MALKDTVTSGKSYTDAWDWLTKGNSDGPGGTAINYIELLQADLARQHAEGISLDNMDTGLIRSEDNNDLLEIIKNITNQGDNEVKGALMLEERGLADSADIEEVLTAEHARDAVKKRVKGEKDWRQTISQDPEAAKIAESKFVEQNELKLGRNRYRLELLDRKKKGEQVTSSTADDKNTLPVHLKDRDEFYSQQEKTENQNALARDGLLQLVRADIYSEGKVIDLNKAMNIGKVSRQKMKVHNIPQGWIKENTEYDPDAKGASKYRFTEEGKRQVDEGLGSLQYNTGKENRVPERYYNLRKQTEAVEATVEREKIESKERAKDRIEKFKESESEDEEI